MMDSPDLDGRPSDLAGALDTVIPFVAAFPSHVLIARRPAVYDSVSLLSMSPDGHGL
jgi:hypothetical protein